jgi:hypothetical protein
MKTSHRICVTAAFTLLGAIVALSPANAGDLFSIFHCGNRPCCNNTNVGPCGVVEGNLFTDEPGGQWYWQRSPEDEKRVVMALFNRYCIRCHGVDGRGVWDIPGIPNFTNTVWQNSRSDGQIARIILEGRGAVMPTFRGVLSLEESWAMARYLRTFVPGTETLRPPTDQSLPQPRPTGK